MAGFPEFCPPDLAICGAGAQAISGRFYSVSSLP